MTDNPTAESAFGGSPSHDPFQAAKASALKAAEELRAAAAQKASEFRSAAEARAQQFRQSAEQKASDLKEKAGELADQTFTEVRVRYDDLRAEAEKFAREKPLQALLTAFGIGFVVGAILRR
ncbi:YqjD family protein [Prosthecobacter sp.]|uniref:YqjD family protein n=1 Tax=Prosthecobacter sp. TaxID=1965333 RepID=UPI003784214C